MSSSTQKAQSEQALEALRKLPETLVKLSPYAQWSRLNMPSAVTRLNETLLVL